ncbi:MAG TPA: hypothetical protein VNA25_20045 [Phycisphaerae bacterium]|nr:hypothetical protein [Phycisphaerae bacterium]HUT60144.1 hypothetical protein [Phycisphaerae bacterium]
MKLSLVKTVFEITDKDRIRTDVFECEEGTQEPLAAQCHLFDKNNGALIMWGSAPCVGGAPCEKRLVFGSDEGSLVLQAREKAMELRAQKKDKL